MTPVKRAGTRELLTAGLALVVALLMLDGRAAAEQKQQGGDPFISAGLPPLQAWGDSSFVDEPQGPYDSVGTTLGHMGRDAAWITKFHAFLDAHGVKPESLVSAGLGDPPAAVCRILIEPETLPPALFPSWGWKRDGDFLVGEAADDGPAISIPVTIERGGLYRLWVGYDAVSNMTGVTSLKLYRKGQEAQGPLLQDEFYNTASHAGGLRWHDVMVELPPASYSVVLGYVVRAWRAPAGVGYGKRRIDCLYLTDEIGADAPLESVRKELQNTGRNTDVQWTALATLAPANRAVWRRWQVRPLGWEGATNDAALFAWSYRFWRREVESLATNDAAGSADYRSPARQIVFDDAWNLVATPGSIRRQRRELQGDVSTSASGMVYYAHRADDVVTSRMRDNDKACDWWPDGGRLVSGTYYNFKGVAWYHQRVEPGRTYRLWVQFRNAGYFEPWQVRAWLEGNTNVVERLHWKRDQRNYPMDIEPQRAWQSIGSIDVPAGCTNPVIRWDVTDLPWGGAAGGQLPLDPCLLSRVGPDLHSPGVAPAAAHPRPVPRARGTAGGAAGGWVPDAAAGDLAAAADLVAGRRGQRGGGPGLEHGSRHDSFRAARAAQRRRGADPSAD